MRAKEKMEEEEGRRKREWSRKKRTGGRGGGRGGGGGGGRRRRKKRNVKKGGRGVRSTRSHFTEAHVLGVELDGIETEEEKLSRSADFVEDHIVDVRHKVTIDPTIGEGGGGGGSEGG